MRKSTKNPVRLHTVFFAVSVSIFTGLCAQERATGMKYDPVSLRSIPYKAKLTAASYKNLPSSASLEKYCPLPGDQGSYGTCVAFATAYHLRTILYTKAAAESGKQVNPNSTLFSPSFVYEQIKDEEDKNCQFGSNPVDAFELLMKSGVARLSTQPYACGTPVKKEALLEGISFRITDFNILYLPDETDKDIRINSVKKALSEGYPCMLGFIVAKSFYGIKGDLWKQQATDDGPSGKHGRHAMCVVGYDDNKYGGAFRVLNSWGTGWADKGFVWIPYADFAKYSLIAIQAYGPKPVPDNKPVDPVVNTALNGSISFRTSTGDEMNASRSLTRNLAVEDAPAYAEELIAYKMNSAYPSGTQFRFFIRTSTEAFIYAFATDQTGKVNKILPFADNMSPHIGSNSTIAFPSETKVVRMDNTPGTDYLMILYSKTKLDANELWNKMNQAKGGLSAKIRAALGDQLILPSAINYNNSDISFSLKPNANGTVVPLMVAITHQ